MKNQDKLLLYSKTFPIHTGIITNLKIVLFNLLISMTRSTINPI